jgi:hypothetical protein
VFRAEADDLRGDGSSFVILLARKNKGETYKPHRMEGVAQRMLAKGNMNTASLVHSTAWSAGRAPSERNELGVASTFVATKPRAVNSPCTAGARAGLVFPRMKKNKGQAGVQAAFRIRVASAARLRRLRYSAGG